MVPVPPAVVEPPPCVRYGNTAVMRTLLGFEKGSESTLIGFVVAQAASTVVSLPDVELVPEGGQLLAQSAEVVL